MAKLNERERLLAMTLTERKYWQNGVLPCGMDEVGRGPLAGPVTAACVMLPSEPLIEHVNDSKKLSEPRRERLCPIIKEAAISFGIGWASHEEIDAINILEATKLAFARAFQNMPLKADVALVDAVKGLDISAEQRPIIHGDAVSYLIAAASVLAKVERDRHMVEMDALYPQYGFARNKGYGTAEHIAALREYGPCPIHRRSFIRKILGE